MTLPLTDLIARLEAATGADREIDAAIYDALASEDGRVAFKVRDWSKEPGSRLSRYHDGWLVGAGSDDQYADDLPRFTASIDAALAFVEKVLPGWVVEHIGAVAVGEPKALKTIGWVVELGYCWTENYQGQGPTLPIAILLAGLNALKSLKEPTK